MVFISYSIHIPFVKKVLLVWLVCLWEILLLLTVSYSSLCWMYIAKYHHCRARENIKVLVCTLVRTAPWLSSLLRPRDATSWCWVFVAFPVSLLTVSLSLRETINILVLRGLSWPFHCIVVEIFLVSFCRTFGVHCQTLKEADLFQLQYFVSFHVLSKKKQLPNMYSLALMYNLFCSTPAV